MAIARPPGGHVAMVPASPLVVPPLDFETGWTGELWSNRVALILGNSLEEEYSGELWSNHVVLILGNPLKEDSIFFWIAKKIICQLF